MALRIGAASFHDGARRQGSGPGVSMRTSSGGPLNYKSGFHHASTQVTRGNRSTTAKWVLSMALSMLLVFFRQLPCAKAASRLGTRPVETLAVINQLLRPLPQICLNFLPDQIEEAYLPFATISLDSMKMRCGSTVLVLGVARR